MTDAGENWNRAYYEAPEIFDAFCRAEDPEGRISRRLATHADLDGKVFWAGPRPVPQLTWLLAQADVLVSPRLKGVNTPMKVYSYLASGIPMIATNIASHTQVLDETTSILCEAEPDAFAQGIDRLLGDEALRANLGTAALALVERSYSRAAFDENVRRFYADVEDAMRGGKGER